MTRWLLVGLVLLPGMAFAQGGLIAWPPLNLGNNLVANSGFETNLSGWTVSGGVTRDCTEAHTGSCSMKIVDLCNVSYTNTEFYTLATTVGGYYRYSVWVKYEDLGQASPLQGIRAGIFTPYGSNGGGASGLVHYGTSDWKEVTLDTIRLNTATLAYFGMNEYSAACGTMWVDDVTVVEELKQPVVAKLIQPSYRGYLWSDMDQEAIFEVTNNLGYIPIDAQDETSYDDTPTTEGTFAGGTGHNASDVITLSDGTTITVDLAPGNVVTEFTVDVAGTQFGNVSGTTISQASTDGSGIDFSLTTGDDNVTDTIETVLDLDPPGSPAISDAVITDGKVTVAIAADGTIAFRNKGQATPTYPEYKIDAIASSSRATWPVSWTDDNRFRVNDTPTFIIGVYDSGLGYTTVESAWSGAMSDKRRLPEMAGDLNGYLNYWYGEAPVAAMTSLMAYLNNNVTDPLLYWGTANCFQSNTNALSFSALTSQAYAETMAATGTYAGVYVMDECLPSVADNVFEKTVVARNWAPETADLVVHHSSKSDNVELWYDVGDIIAADPYPLFRGEPAEGYNLAQVGTWSEIVKDAVSDARPFMMVLQYFQFGKLGRWPTEAELRNMSYMAIVEGAQGIFYWSLGVNGLRATCDSVNDWCDTKVELYGRLKNVVAELRDNEAIFLAADAPANLIAVNNSNIRTLVKEGYILAYNDTRETQQATFTWDELVTTVVALDEGSPDRSITPSSAQFSDTFTAFEAHVYQITSGGAPPDPEFDPVSNTRGHASATSVRVIWGDSTLASDVSCSAVLKNSGGSTLETNVLSEGFSTRHTGFDGLTADTEYAVVVTCTDFEDFTHAFRTKPALTGTTTYSIALAPNEILTTAAKAKVEYRIPGGGTSSETNASCGSGCTVDLTLNRGVLYEIRHQWLTSGDAVLATSAWRNVTVQ